MDYASMIVEWIRKVEPKTPIKIELLQLTEKQAKKYWFPGPVRLRLRLGV